LSNLLSQGSAASGWGEGGLSMRLAHGEFPCCFSNDREAPYAVELMLDAGSQAGPRRLQRRALPLEHFRATQPALRHPAPCRLARRIAGELGHLLTLSGVPEKFFRWIHEARRIHGSASPR
jgi:hypothetical protein